MIASNAESVAKYLDELRFSDALGVLGNHRAREQVYGKSAPWKLAKDETCRVRLDTVLYTVPRHG